MLLEAIPDSRRILQRIQLYPIYRVSKRSVRWCARPFCCRFKPLFLFCFDDRAVGVMNAAAICSIAYDSSRWQMPMMLGLARSLSFRVCYRPGLFRLCCI